MPCKMDQYSSPSRKLLGLFSILLFSGEWRSLPELALTFNCSKQTISRLIEEIELSHEAKIDRERRGRTLYFRIRRPATRPNVSLSPTEISQLVMCRDLVVHLLPKDMQESVERTIRHATALLPNPAESREALDSRIQISVRGHIDYTPFHGFLDLLLQAMRERHVCEVTYLAINRDIPKTYEIAPMGFLAYHEALYVSAWKVTPKGTPEVIHPMLLALHRLKEVLVTRRTFDLPPPPSDTTGLFGLMPQSPFRAVIRFDRAVAPYIRERRWSTEQTITEQGDGGVVLELSAKSEAELISWVLSFRMHAELLEPAYLRQILADDLAYMLTLYGSPARRVSGRSDSRSGSPCPANTPAPCTEEPPKRRRPPAGAFRRAAFSSRSVDLRRFKGCSQMRIFVRWQGKQCLPCGSAAAVMRVFEHYGWRPQSVLLSYSTGASAVR